MSGAGPSVKCAAHHFLITMVFYWDRVNNNVMGENFRDFH